MKNLENLSHAYLFISPDSFYNNLLAKLFCFNILCEDRNFCKQCQTCKKNLAGTNLDLIELPKDKSIVVEDINYIVDKSIERPMLGDYKIFILRDIDNSTIQSQNKLLKTLEEPPSHVIFVLTATNEYKILPTIISRTRKIYLPKLDKNKLENILCSPPAYLNAHIPPNISLPAIKQAIEDGDGWLGKTLELLSIDSFKDLHSLCNRIACNFSQSKDLPLISCKILEHKDCLENFLSLLQNKFSKLLEENKNMGYCDIIEFINNSSEELTRNVSPNIIIDNLLMKILETKYNYNL